MDRVRTDPALVVALPLAGARAEVRPAEDPAVRLDALVVAARAGDLQAWSRLYQETFDALLKHVCYLVGDAAVAEDLVQDVYARAITNVRQFDGRASFIGWLRGIALNVVRMHWRRTSTSVRVHERLREAVALATGGATASLDREHAQEQRMRLLYELLATLPENLREAFVLRELEGLPPTEAAQQLGISEGNLAVRASRARARIRKSLEQLGWTEGAP
ncbi:MAG TPA: RNA polymerase sigma factor [Nannocystaceae bacterium]|nr:RNA polymerase sigma factor [Nannocystaceae bacterium]